MKTIAILLFFIFHIKSDFNCVDQLCVPIFLEQRPIRIFHGLGDSCRNFPNEDILKCVETGEWLLRSTDDLEIQAKIGCELLANEVLENKELKTANPEFRYGFHLVGVSQGGLIVRLIFRDCDLIRPFIKRIVTYGTPNLGINEIPSFSGKSVLNKIAINLLHYFTTSKYKKNNWSFYQYLNEEVKKKKKKEFRLAPIIQKLLSPEFAEQTYDNLELMVNVMFLQDKMVNPHFSSSFDILYDKSSQSFSELGTSKLFDESGLRKLWEKGRLITCAIDADHLDYSKKQINEIYSFLFEEKEISVPWVFKYFLKRFYFENLWDILQNSIFEELKCSNQKKDFKIASSSQNQLLILENLEKTKPEPVLIELSDLMKKGGKKNKNFLKAI